jgi:UDPglucose 6-dehydrogenase
MKISVIGTGHVGLATALSFASRAHKVTCYDISEEQLSLLRQGTVTYYEPGLQAALQSELAHKSIEFVHTTGTPPLTDESLVIICVGTPNNSSGLTDTSAIELILQELDQAGPAQRPVVIKSTTPPGTNEKLSQRFKNLLLMTSPEFLREGSALQDALSPNRVVVGCDHSLPKAKEIFTELYRNFNLEPSRLLWMSSVSAELCKYAANVFLATRVSLINEFSQLAENVGADITEIKKGLMLDPRIGSEFLNCGLGYGGSCFPKDIEALLSYSEQSGLNLPITKATQQLNRIQLDYFLKKIVTHTDPTHGALAILGLSFKPDTDDLREAPALKLIEQLIQLGYKLKVYDPKARHSPRAGSVEVCSNAESALKDSQAAVFCTEWPEFYELSPMTLKNSLKTPLVFDGRNIFAPHTMRLAGLSYHSVGRRAEK